MDGLEEEELERIKRRAGAATDGRWEVGERGSVAVHGRGEIASFPRPQAGGVMEFVANREFVAHAREDVPKLVAEVRRLRAALLVVRATLHPYWPTHTIPERLSRSERLISEVVEEALAAPED